MIEKAIIIALLVLSIWYTMQEEQIFEKLGDWLMDHLPEAIHKPVFDCPICMSPWYGSVLYWLIPWQKIGIQESTLIGWPVAIIVAMGFNIVITKSSND